MNFGRIRYSPNGRKSISLGLRRAAPKPSEGGFTSHPRSAPLSAPTRNGLNHPSSSDAFRDAPRIRCIFETRDSVLECSPIVGHLLCCAVCSPLPLWMRKLFLASSRATTRKSFCLTGKTPSANV